MLKKMIIVIGLLAAVTAFSAFETQVNGNSITVVFGDEKVTIDAARGGTIVEYHYRNQLIPTKLHGDEQLCRVRLSKPDSAEFMGKWEIAPLEKKDGKTIIPMSCEGPFFSRITKEFIFEDGKPGFLLRLLLHRESEGVGTAKYTMWLQNKLTIAVGKYALAISGRENPLLLVGQLPREVWSYAPSENYSGIVNLENGFGLFMLASNKSLDAFYVWASLGDITNEICFRNIEIKATETVDFEVRFLPVSLNQEQLKSLTAGKYKPAGVIAATGISKVGSTNEPGVVEAEVKEPTLGGKKLFVADYNKSLDGQNAAGVVPAMLDQRNVAIVADGRFGNCAKISGGGGIVYPVKGNINPNKGCIEMWISPDFPPEDKEWRYLFRMEGKAIKKDFNANCVHLVRSGHNQLRASIFDKNGLMRRAYRGSLDFQPGKWYHVRMVWNFERPVYKTQYIELYIDGSNRGNEYGLADKKIEFELESPTFSIGANYKGKIDGASIASEPEFEEAKPERQIDLDAMKPAIKWLKPHINGNTKVLFFADYNCAEDISALAGMMDLNVKAVKFVYPYPCDSIFMFYDNQSILSNGDAAARMRQALTEKYDVIVIGPASVKQHIPADIQNEIAAQVKKGTGLIVVTPHDFAKQPLGKLLPVETTGKKAGDGKMSLKSGAALSGVPMAALPSTFFQTLAALPGAESIAVSGVSSPVIVKGASGGGKVYVFGWLGINESMIGRFENLNATTSLTPNLNRKGENKYWLNHLKRYYRLLLAEAILDAAGKTSGYSISAIGNEHGVPELEINAPEGGKAELDCLISASEGLWQRGFTQAVTLERGGNRIKPEVKFGVPGGKAQLDVVLRINGKAAVCGGFAMDVNTGANINSITAADIWRQGATEDVTVNFSGNADGGKVKLTATDKNDRIGAESEQNVSGSNAVFKVDSSRLLSPFVRLTAELRDADGKIKAVATLDRILLPAKRPDFSRLIHYTWGKGEDGFPLEYGLMGQYWHKTGCIDFCNAGTQPIPYFWRFGSKAGYEDGSLKDKIVNGKHIRGGSLSDPQFLAKTEQELTARTITWKKYEPPVYILNDETRHSPSAHVYWEGDYHPAALEKFREWLKVRYASLDKLNMEWGTNFTAWSAVQPMTLEEVKKRGSKNFAPWADFREFNDDAFAKYVKFCADTIKKNDPGVRTGMSGTESPYVSSGWDWWKMSGALGTVWSYDGIQIELLRSFAPYRDIVVNNYSIGYGWHGPELFYMMFRSMLNQSHGLASWKADLFYTPEGSLSLPGKDTKRIIDIFRTGLWDYTRSFKREKNVAVLYSMASVRAAFAEGKYERYRDSVQGWADLLYDCCISWSFIAGEQLEKGILEQEKYQAVVLPAAMAISDAGIAALKRFVSGGGAVIMDDSAGMFTANCKPRAQTLRQELSGEKVKVINDNMIQYMVDGKFYKKASLSVWQQKFRSIFESLGVKPFAQISVNGSPFHGHSSIYSGADGSRLLLVLPAYQISTMPQNMVEVKTDFSGNIWSPVTHTVYRDGIKDKVERGWPLAAVMSPEKGGTFEVNVVQNDGRMEYAINAGASSFVPTYFTVQALDPQGKPVIVYNNSLIVVTPGSYSGAFKLALNDPKGEWSIVLTDGLTGRKYVKTFNWR